MVLAQMESVSAGWLKDFLLIVAGLAAAAYYIKEIFWGEKRESVPQPLQTQKIWPAATLRDLENDRAEVKRRLDAHDKDLAELREVIRIELPEMERRIAAAGEGRVEKIHNRINEVLAEVSKLEGMMERDHGG